MRLSAAWTQAGLLLGAHPHQIPHSQGRRDGKLNSAQGTHQNIFLDVQVPSSELGQPPGPCAPRRPYERGPAVKHPHPTPDARPVTKVARSTAEPSPSCVSACVPVPSPLPVSVTVASFSLALPLAVLALQAQVGASPQTLLLLVVWGAPGGEGIGLGGDVGR